MSKSYVAANDDKMDVEHPATDAATWDPNTLPPNFSMVILAKRRSGKTHMLRDFLYTIRKRFDDAYLFCSTKEFQCEEYAFVPPANQYDGLNDEVVGHLFEEQAELARKQKTNKNVKMSRILLIFDDVISDDNIRRSPVFQALFTKGRWHNFTVIVLAQDFSGKYGIPIVCRRNCDCAIAFMIDAEYDRKTMYGQYCSKESLREGTEYAQRIVQTRYQAAVFDLCNTTSTKSRDYIYKYMAAPTPKQFKIGTHHHEDLPVAKKPNKINVPPDSSPIFINVQIRKPQS